MYNYDYIVARGNSQSRIYLDRKQLLITFPHPATKSSPTPSAKQSGSTTNSTVRNVPLPTPAPKFDLTSSHYTPSLNQNSPLTPKPPKLKTKHKYQEGNTSCTSTNPFQAIKLINNQQIKQIFKIGPNP